MSPAVADLMASELGWDEIARKKQLAAFRDVVRTTCFIPE
jgi:hypothetical protein